MQIVITFVYENSQLPVNRICITFLTTLENNPIFDAMERFHDIDDMRLDEDVSSQLDAPPEEDENELRAARLIALKRAIAFWFYLGLNLLQIKKPALSTECPEEETKNTDVKGQQNPKSPGSLLQYFFPERSSWVFPVLSLSNIGAIPHSDLNQERNRLSSFRSNIYIYPGDMNKVKDLARSGFYYVGNGYQIACYFCGGRTIDHGDVYQMHSRLSPVCPMVTGAPCNNVRLRDNLEDPLSVTRAVQATEDDDYIPVAVGTPLEDIPLPEANAVTPVLNLRFSTPGRRNSTFPCNHPMAESLSKAGFFFEREEVCCWWCGIRFSFEQVAVSVVDIWVLHACESPECGFLNLRMGPEQVQRWSLSR